MEKKVFLYIKPRKIEGRDFVFSEQKSNIKNTEEIFQDQLNDIDFKNYEYIIDCCKADDTNDLYSLLKGRVSSFREDILYINERDIKYINFDYFSIFEQSLYFTQELILKNKIMEKQEIILDFVTRIYNSAIREQAQNGTENQKRLAIGIKLNEFLKLNSAKEYILVNDLSQVMQKANTEFVTINELTVVGEIQKRALETFKE